MITRFIHSFLDLFFPVFCFGCGKEKHYICENCRRKIIPQEKFLKTKYCSEIYSASRYNNPVIKNVVRNFKYKGVKGASRDLALIIFQNINYFSIKNKKSHILIPVPISRKKLNQRGYNQSLILAKEISKIAEIPLVENILIKKFHTLSQVEAKTKKERRLNLKGSFAVVNAAPGLKNNTIILVDDIITTGETMNEAAKTLKKAGFTDIIGITIARG